MTETLAQETSPEGENNGTEYTLYFIRHGEALHNMKEKEAMAQAKMSATAQGLDSEQVLERMEMARSAVLDDDTLIDPALSPQGKEDASNARQAIQELHLSGLPEPTEVLVSPLQRTLQTAAIVFPESQNIHVRNELKERQTKKACDTNQGTRSIARRGTFQRFSMSRLRVESIKKLNFPYFEEYFGEFIEGKSTFNDDNGNDEEQVEEKARLRDRTQKLFQLLLESEHRVVAIVTHKGYLRELERGPLGQETAKEFTNCEVRVYKVKFDEGKLDTAERIA